MTSGTFDINEARLAHLRWEMALKDLINGAIRPLDGHENCPLGKWIDDEGGLRYADNKTFMVLKVAHKQFHRLASDFINLVAAGDVRNTSEYIDKIKQASQQVLFLLTSIELGSIKDVKGGLVNRVRGWVRKRPEGDHQCTDCSTLSVSGARLTHLHWVGELQKLLSGGRKMSNIQSAENCPLGLWLHKSMSIKSHSHFGLNMLDSVHRMFHRLIEDTVSALQHGNYQIADDCYNKAYDCSAEVIMLLTKLEVDLRNESASPYNHQPSLRIR